MDDPEFFFISQEANPDHVATNDLVWELLEILHRDGGLPLGKDKAATLNRQRACLAANFLSAVRRMQKGKKKNFIFRGNRNHWHNRTKIGTKMVRGFRMALIKSGVIIKVRGHYNDVDGLGFDSKAELFEISESLLGKVASTELSFTNCSYLNPVTATVRRNKSKDTKTIAISENSPAYQQLIELRDWHAAMPLITPEGAELGYGTRSFNSYDQDVGGRYQCAYTNEPASERAKYTLNGERIVEVDISACNPTILTALTGKVHPSWLGREVLNPYETLITEDFSKAEIKDIIVRLIGAGNAKKRAGAADYQLGLAEVSSTNGKGEPTRFKGTKRYKALLKHLREMLPGLNDLKRGVLDSNTLSYHESAIMTRIAHGRMHMGHPTYILHDGLIVPESHGPSVAEHIQLAFEGYCDQMGWPLLIKPSVTQERAKEGVADRLPMMIVEWH